MRVLVTGVAGFIGSHVAERFLADGHDVFGCDNMETGLRGNVPDGCDFWFMDVAQGDSVRHLFDIARPDVVYHAAASYRDRLKWHQDARTNVLGSINVAIEARRHAAKVVYFQTSLCYGTAPASPVERDHPLAPVGSYAVSKTAGEAYIRDSGVDWVSLRLANVYGPRNLSGPVPAFYKRLAAGEPCTVVDSRRDFIFIDDLVAGAVHAAGSHGVHHVASGGDHSILEVFQAVADAMGLDVPPPALTPRGEDDAATILLRPDYVCITPLREGVERAVEWYADHGVGETFTHLAVRG